MSAFWKGLLEGFGMVGAFDLMVGGIFYIFLRNGQARKEDRLKKIEADIKKLSERDVATQSDIDKAIKNTLDSCEVKFECADKRINLLMNAGLTRNNK